MIINCALCRRPCGYTHEELLQATRQCTACGATLIYTAPPAERRVLLTVPLLPNPAGKDLITLP